MEDNRTYFYVGIVHHTKQNTLSYCWFNDKELVATSNPINLGFRVARKFGEDYPNKIIYVAHHCYDVNKERGEKPEKVFHHLSVMETKLFRDALKDELETMRLEKKLE